MTLDVVGASITTEIARFVSLDWVAQIAKDLFYGAVCAIPFVWTKRYIVRMPLCMIAPVAFRLWVLWGVASWSALEYFKIDSDFLITVLGGFGSAHLKFLASGWSSKESGIAFTDRLKNMSAVAGVSLSMAATVLGTYLVLTVTSGFWWDAYFPTVVMIIFVTICAAWSYGLNTTAFVWTSAFGGYVGSLVASVYRDWGILEATVGSRHYDYAFEMLMLPEYFLFAVAGALAAFLMIGLSVAYMAMRRVPITTPNSD